MVKAGINMIHFTLGPVEMYERTKAIGALQNTYFRIPEFSSLIGETDLMLRQFLNAPDKYHTFFMASSGTGAMEAVLLNCFTPNDTLLIINGGTFSEYFIKLCEYQRIPFVSLDLPFGETLLPEMLLPYENKGYAALLVNINETSTGQLYDKTVLRDFCRRNGMFFIVDAISSVCADELDIQVYDMDAVILSSQKGFACSPGLGIVILSDTLYDERVLKNKVRSMYFDLKEYAINMERFQTPFTPAIGIIYQLHDMLDYLLSIGAAKVISHTRSLANQFREKINDMGGDLKFKPLDYPLSNALTPIYLTGVSAFDVHVVLRDKYGIMINPSGLLPHNLLRVGHFGNVCEEDYNMLISVLKTVLSEMHDG